MMRLLLAILWLILYRPMLDYFSIIYGREDFRTNQLALVGVVALIALQARGAPAWPRIAAGPRLHRPALVLMLGASLAYLAAERYLGMNTVSATLFGLATYGLVGLWIDPGAWRRGFPAALLLIGTLPFGEHLQTFVGYPLRIGTAAIVQHGLAAIGVPAIGVDTILVLENGVSQIDLPCSGVKSLWTGLLFLVAATWIERRPLGRRWLGVAALLAVLLVAANVARVAILVGAGIVAGWPRLAEMLHVPLGVLGFAAACAVAVVALRRMVPAGANPDNSGEGTYPLPDTLRAPVPPPPAGNEGSRSENPPPPPEPPPPAQRGRTALRRRSREAGGGENAAVAPPTPRLLPALVAAVAAMAALYTPRPADGLAHAAPTWRFPADLAVEPFPLQPGETDWLVEDGAESAGRYRFQWRGLEGSMILVTSATWRAHHRPERCFEVYGLRLEDSRAELVAPGFPLRWVQLRDPGRDFDGGPDSDPGTIPALAAAYWFQSADRTTDDYGTRIWADVALRRQRWVMVSMVFDTPVESGDPAARTLFRALHEAVSTQLDVDDDVDQGGTT